MRPTFLATTTITRTATTATVVVVASTAIRTTPTTAPFLVDAFTSGAFASPSYIGKKEKVLSKDYQPEFALALALKDSKLNIELQQEVGLPLPVQREIHRALEKAVDEGLGEEDLFALEKYYKGL